MTEVMLTGTEQFILGQNNGRADHRIRIAPPMVLPNIPAPPEGYGVVIVLDGEHLFGTVFEAARMRTMMGSAPPVVVVGLSYPDDVFTTMCRRAFDFTPPTPRDKYPADAPMIGSNFGGAAAFLDFILGDVWNAIDARWTVNPSARTLIGYSLGGLFALHALFDRPEAFQSVCVLSPSLWWNDFEILGRVPAFVDRIRAGESTASVLLTVGGQEQDEPVLAPPGMSLDALVERTRSCRMVDAVLELGAVLEAAGGDCHTARFEGEDHGSVIPAALGRALQFSAGSGRSAT